MSLLLLFQGEAVEISQGCVTLTAYERYEVRLQSYERYTVTLHAYACDCEGCDMETFAEPFDFNDAVAIRTAKSDGTHPWTDIEEDEPITPASVTFTVKKPDGTEDQYTLASSEVEELADGDIRLLITVDQAGSWVMGQDGWESVGWQVRVEGTGLGQAADRIEFDVEDEWES